MVFRFYEKKKTMTPTERNLNVKAYFQIIDHAGGEMYLYALSEPEQTTQREVAQVACWRANNFSSMGGDTERDSTITANGWYAS
jgi:hypothetical protein